MAVPDTGAPVRVAIDAHLVSGEFGGVEQVVIGLAHGLSGLSDGDDDYCFLTYEGDQPWLEPYIGGNCRIVRSQRSPAPSAWKRAAKSIAPGLAPTWRRLRYGAARPELGPPPSDGTVERLGSDVVHLPRQDGFLTAIPSIYHPHDLQHLHLPQFFDPDEIARREAMYRPMCERATMVTVTSQWNKADLIEHYGLPEQKIVVIQLAPAIAAYDEPSPEELQRAKRRLGLPQRYIFFPAQTWPHKNHVRLLEALAQLKREDGLTVSLVLAGRQNEYSAAIRSRTAELGLVDTTLFLGYLGAEDIQVVYRLADAVVIPTLFEAAGGFGPLAEAFTSGVPAAVSDVNALPEEAGDAALVFDPNDVGSIARAVKRIWLDDELRMRLVWLGKERVSRFTWERTARTFRAHYRRIAGRRLTNEDEALIAAPPAF